MRVSWRYEIWCFEVIHRREYSIEVGTANFANNKFEDPVYDNENENWRILTNKKIYENVKKPTIIEKIRLNRLGWFGHGQRLKENRIPKRVLCMNFGTRLRGRPRNRG